MVTWLNLFEVEGKLVESFLLLLYNLTSLCLDTQQGSVKGQFGTKWHLVWVRGAQRVLDCLPGLLLMRHLFLKKK